MMENMLDYFNEVSLFGVFDYSPDLFIPILIVLINLLLTLVHSTQELEGRLWRYFGAIAGVRIPDVFGFLFFFLSLTVGLWGLGFVGITRFLPFYGQVPQWVAMIALGALIGGRLSDRRYSHRILDQQGYRPNPGLASTPYYFVEALFLTVLFLPGLWNHYITAAIGFAAGWLLFRSILPGLRLLRGIRPLRCKPWKIGEAKPDSNDPDCPPYNPDETFLPMMEH